MNTTALKRKDGDTRGMSGSSHYAVTAIQKLHEDYGLPYQATSFEMLLTQSMASGVGIHAVRLTNDVYLFGYVDDATQFFDLKIVSNEPLVDHAFIIQGRNHGTV